MNIINNYDNLDENLAKIFNIDIIKQIKYIEGITWTKWRKYENNEKIINFIKEKINEKINKYSFLRCKHNINNSNMLLIELDILLDRNIKFLIISLNNNYYDVIIAKTIGIFNDIYNNYQEFNYNNDRYDTNEKKLNLEIEYNLIYKILKDY